MVIRRELRRKLVEYVRRVSAAGQEDYGSARTAPIEHFKPNVIVDRHKLYEVRGWVLPRGGLL